MELLQETQDNIDYEGKYGDMAASFQKSDLADIIDKMLETLLTNDEEAQTFYVSLGKDLQNGLDTTFVSGPLPSVADIYLYTNVSQILQLMTW